MSVNLTPMIDVVFLLLCFSMTVSRFSRPEGVLPADLPARTASVSTAVPRTPIRVRLTAGAGPGPPCEATIERFQESPVPIRALADRLRAIQREVPGCDADTPVHLSASDTLAWDHVVNAYNAALAAGYRKVLFAGAGS